MNHLTVGRRGEEIARALLKKRGYKILETNVRVRLGEIDIVARRKDCLVFVEVRTRTSRNFGTPEESVTKRKRDKLVACALDYVASHGEMHDRAWRIDVVAVELDSDGQQTRADIVENAVPVE
ncbi:MAG TPA: YraN family protein [Dehalococcoidia bacterium]|nr:YraN family protein [Dehalococcoidia bacterium]